MKGTKNIYLALLIIIFVGVVFHAPISVWLSSIFSDSALLIKAWKEILMLPAVVLAAAAIIRFKKYQILREPVVLLVGLYALLHLLVISFSFGGWEQTLAGLAIDLRFLVFFLLIYAFARLYTDVPRRLFVDKFWVASLVVVVFGALQVLALPPDSLKVIGYGPDTIQPYLTVDESQDFVRINSTLRGPNPLGAYVVIFLSLLASFAIVKGKFVLQKLRNKVLFGVMVVAALITLWGSYSRSAGLAMAVATLLILAYFGYQKFGKKIFGYIGVGLAILSIPVALLWNTPIFSYVVLHENPSEMNDTNSNDQHVESIFSGTDKVISEPFGSGVGSAGSASLLGDKPFIVENQYLFIGHEIGWLGLGLFVAIFGLIMVGLWSVRGDWLAMGVFASGAGMAIIGLLLPVWVDDTVSIIWWGLAGLALGTGGLRVEGGTKKHGK